jgi:MFS family permease
VMADAGGTNGSNRLAITICVSLATLMQALDTTIANVALPYMQGSVSASQDQIDWVLTSYIVAAAIMTPPTGFFAARFGLKRLFLVSIAGFTVASMLCGAAQSLTQIVVFRLLQGAFGAALVPLSQSVLFSSYPREQQGFAMALFGLGVMVGPVIGPVLGGWLTENYTWRYVFYINLPIGIVCILGLIAFLPDTPRNVRERLDWFGFATLSIAIGALQIALDRGELKDWFGSGEIVIEVVVSASAFYLFIVHTLTAQEPQFRRWRPVHRDCRFDLLCLVGAAAAFSSGPVELSGRHIRVRDGAARYRDHGGHAAGRQTGRPCRHAVTARHRTRPFGLFVLPDDRLDNRRLRRNDCLGGRHSGRRTRFSVRAAERHHARHVAAPAPDGRCWTLQSLAHGRLQRGNFDCQRAADQQYAGEPRNHCKKHNRGKSRAPRPCDRSLLESVYCCWARGAGRGH